MVKHGVANVDMTVHIRLLSLPAAVFARSLALSPLTLYLTAACMMNLCLCEWEHLLKHRGFRGHLRVSHV